MHEVQVLVLLSICCAVSAPFSTKWISPTTTKAEMWNPLTWLTPYCIALSEGVRDFFKKTQEIQNQLYLQAEASNAFSWLCPWNWFKKEQPTRPGSGIQNVGPGNRPNNIPAGAGNPSAKPSNNPQISGFPKPLPSFGNPNVNFT